MPIDRGGPRLGPMEESARGLARLIDKALRETHGERVGFALFMFDLGPAGWMTYLSNAERDDMRRTVAEWLEKEGGAVHEHDCPHAQDCTCRKERP